MHINMIIAIGKNGIIGNSKAGGGLPWNCPDDMARFVKLTKNDGKGVVIMGRITASLMKRPLPSRRNVVLSRAPGLKMVGYEVYGSLRGFLERSIEAKDDLSTMWVIGGAQIYEELFRVANDLELDIDMHISWIPGDHVGDVKVDLNSIIPTTLYKTQIMKTEITPTHVYQHIKRFR